MLCFQLRRPHSSHLQHFLTISSHVRWDKEGESSVNLEGAPTVRKFIFFTRLLKFSRFGVCPAGLGYPTRTHPSTPEITHGTTRANISVPLGSSCWNYQNDRFPLSCPKGGPHLFLCYSSMVPPLRGASWPLGLFQQHKVIQRPSPQHQWGRSFQLHLLRWTLSTSSEGQCLADYRTAISKKTIHFFVDTLFLLFIESFPNTTNSFLLSFMSKGTSLVLLRSPSPPKDIFWWTWLWREEGLSDPYPLEPKDWDASSWLC